MHGIIQPPTREEFLECILTKGFYPEAIKLTMRAWDWCGKYHAGQPREDKSDYPDHPRSAAWILLQEIGEKNPETIILALLHDVCEIHHRRPPSHRKICKIFGYPIAYKLKALTKTPGQPVQEYSRQVFFGGGKVVIAKFADRLHNLRTLGVCDADKQKRIINDTRIYYYPFTGSYKEFFHEVSIRDVEKIQRLWAMMEVVMLELEKKLEESENMNP